MDSATNYEGLEGIAIIGMAGRFPRAKSIDEFWQNLQSGVESISVFTDEEVLSNGIDLATLNVPNYVKASAILEDIDLFDASFFSFNPKEAEVTDPQHRLFLECAWEALENAGYDSQKYTNRIGVYAGASLNNYYSLDLNREAMGSAQCYQTLIGNDKDFLTTRVSYKLNLTGPSITVQTACSTSLVATTLASQSLLNYQCDMALAGGVSIHVPQKTGYLYEQGGTLSPDGHCRAFDAKAGGTTIGNGVGVVLLKRLSDALADGDYIHAVIKGSAINNDGSGKVGYTAPSVNGQAQVIGEAMMLAGVEPETINYIEAHGTGTVLGDPIEIAALSQVFRSSTQKKNFCGIGSVKTNIGHLDAAAGITGLIKTVLALKHKQIPPSLNFEQPNPQIDFANSPFYVNTKLADWKAGSTPRRAGVSSLGIGGTNAHVILEEAPTAVELSDATSLHSRPWQLLLLSAKTESALQTATHNLAQHLTQYPHLNLADVAYTLQVGRAEFNHRRVLICKETQDAVSVLQMEYPQRVFTDLFDSGKRPIAFMFPGQGAQYVDMGKELYQTEPIFKEQVDLCCQLLQPYLGLDLRSLIYPNESELKTAAEKLQQTDITQPALFVIEYALAKLWLSWGISPDAMIGHSIGEYVAACLAGVMSLTDALVLVAARGQLMQQLPTGAMLSVPLPEEEVRALLDEKLSLAACNAPALCVVSGTHDAIEAFQNKLQGIECRRLHTSHAFHSPMVEPILERFQKEVSKVKLSKPKIPFISNVTGTWITASQATDPNYWVKHLRSCVRFSDGISALQQEPKHILLEVGPGRTLCTFAQKHSDAVGLCSLRHPQEKHSDVAFLMNTLGKLWLSGVQIDWSGFYAHERRYRLPLPTYPFERQRYWIHDQKLSPSTKGHLQGKPTAPELWKSLVEIGDQQASEGISEFDNRTYLANKQCLEHLCTAYMNHALLRLGAFRNPSDKYSHQELFEQCQIIPRYQQLLYRWLDVLVEQGHLQKDNEIYTKILPLSRDSINNLVEEFRVKWADTPQQIELVQSCGENLANVLIGEKEPLELHVATLAKEGEISRQNLPADIYYNGVMRAILEMVVKSLPSEVKLRIMEIGGGTGIATNQLLPVLPSKQTSYTFTDVGSLFLTEAKKKFSAYPFVEYRLLNIEQPPTEQGYTSHSFDVVVAVNVLHVTQNIGKTLEHVRSLLAPEGLLLLHEITQPQLDFDITDGLLMNLLEEEQRSRGNPFLSREQWQEALRNHGFVEVAAFSETDVFGQHVLVAQASAEAINKAPVAFTATFKQQDADKALQVLSGKKPDIADWFYIPSWKRSILPKCFTSIQASHPECWLVFLDECGLGEKIVKRLEEEGQDVIAVRVGSDLTKLGDRLYTLNPQERNDYDALLSELQAQGKSPKTIVHLWNVTENHNIESGPEWVDLAQEKGFYSLLFLAQALGKQNPTDEFQIKVISNNIHEVTGDEVLCPEKATALGPVKVISKEYPNITCLSIDVVIPKSGTRSEQKLINHLLAEFTTKSSDIITAYRGSHRWVQSFEPIQLDKPYETIPRLREGGVYLITGGLGGIGLVIAEYLAKTVRAKLVLTGRSAFPAREEWEQWLLTHDEHNSVSYKIRQLQTIKALGAEVLVVNANVASLEQMQEAIAQLYERFGQLHGVIHAAGISPGGMIQRKTKEMAESILAPKVKGTLVLDTITKDIQLDFFILCSSLSSIIGEVGMVDHCGANAFLDAFAHRSTSQYDRFTVSINWDAWQDVGQAAEAARQRARIQDIPQTPHLKEVTHTLFDQCIVEGSEQEIYITNFSVSKYWVLDEHRVVGKATLPGTAYLEMAIAAFENHANNGTIEIREVYFLTPLVVEEDEVKEVRTVLKKQGDRFEFMIMSQSNLGSEQWLEHARGEIACVEAISPEKHEIKEIEARCDEQEIIITESEQKSHVGYVEFGSRWNNLKQGKFGKNQGLAILELPELFVTDINLYKLHPALLDNATGFLSARNEGAYLPFSYKRLTVKAPLPNKIYSYIRSADKNQSQKGTLKYNITIMDEQGTELVDIEEYTLRKIDIDTIAAQQSHGQIEKTPPVPESQNCYLEIASFGILDSLTFRPATRQKPGLGEVEIEVCATGLNFKEVLIALGMIPIPPDIRVRFGRECAGKIVAIGEGVEGFKVGDEVIAFGESCFSPFITTPASVVAPKPDHLSLEEAATLPAAFMTAYYALIKVGRLSQGERVLIHAAAGGVGMAAVQIAQWVGAEIFATAGNPEKRAFLHSKGIEHVMDSRSLSFADEVLKHTDGKGVDVVLNSLAGEFLTKSLSILAPYGRFLELGKRDILNNSQLSLRPFDKCLSFFALEVNQELPDFSSTWREVVQHFKDGNFSPLPHRVFPITEVAHAFEYMTKAKHIGKIVVSVQDKEALRKLVTSENTMSQEERETVVLPAPLRSVSSVSSLQEKPVTSTNVFQSYFHKEGLLPKEGIEAFSRILGAKLSQVLVSTQDSQILVEQNNAFSSPSVLEVLEKDNLSKSTHSRPQLSNHYVAPRNEIEQAVTKIWQELLGRQQVGIHDNFFELGGDSLVMVQVRSKLHQKFNSNISTADLFEYPTISALAEYLSRKQVEQPVFEQVRNRAKKQEEVMEEEMQLMKQRRRVHE